MSDRRYTEEEVEEILKQAAEVEHSEKSLVPSSRGMTLAELDEIGRQAGISPEAIRFAAQRIEKPQAPTRRFLGIPIGVGRTVELERKLTDSEWETIVGDLRETFHARGVLKDEGSLRSWRNGNLQALLEPTPTGQRLRLQTVRGGAEGWISAGLGMFGVEFVMILNAAMTKSLGDPALWSWVTILSTVGTGMVGLGAFGLSRWAKLRQSQMNEIAERVSTNTLGNPMPDV